jgi:hypothetical protein
VSASAASPITVTYGRSSTSFTDRAEAADYARSLHEHGIDCEVRQGTRLLAIYGDEIEILDGHGPGTAEAQQPEAGQLHPASAEQPYDSFQAPGINTVLQRAFGDTPGLAVYGRRCVKAPMGCGKDIEGLCRAEHGGERPCLLPADHTGDHVDYDEYRGNQAAFAQFRSQADFAEWTHTGMCQACQDRMQTAGAAAEQLDQPDL